MNGSITLNKRFLGFSWPRRWWYRLMPARRFEKYMMRLGKRGVEKMDLEGLKPKDRNWVLKTIITKSPQTALDTINAGDIRIKYVDFSASDAYRASKFPLLKFAYASACADWGFSFAYADQRHTGLEVARDVIKEAIDYNVMSDCDTRTQEILAETFIRWPFYLGGIALLDFYLFPHMISRSVYFLASKSLDYFEWVPFILDLSLGISTWGLGFKYETFRKLEPYKYFPLPLVGYWAGRSAKKLLQFSGMLLFKMPILTIAILLSTSARYFRLRLCELFRKNTQKRLEAILDTCELDMRVWNLQKGLIERWLKKDPVKAQMFFERIIERNQDITHFIKSLEFETIEKLAPGLSLSNLASILTNLRVMLREEKAVRLFVGLDQSKQSEALLEESMKIALAKLSPESKARILSEFSTQEDKIAFLKASDLKEMGKIFDEYICRDALELMMRVNRELFDRDERVENIADLVLRDVTMHYASFVKILEFATEEEFKSYVLSNLNKFLYCLIYDPNPDDWRANPYRYAPHVEKVIREVSPSKLIPLIKDLVDDKLPKKLVAMLEDLPLERICEIIKVLPGQELKIEFLKRFSKNRQNEVLIEMLKFLRS